MDKHLKDRLSNPYNSTVTDLAKYTHEAIVVIEELERTAMPVLGLPQTVVAEIRTRSERYKRLLDNVRYLRDSKTDTELEAIYNEKMKSGEISRSFVHRLEYASQTLPSDLDTVDSHQLEYALKIMGNKEVL